MMRRVSGILALGAAIGALAAGCGLARVWEPTRQQVLERILPSSVQVVVEQREGRRVRAGSGVAIAWRPSDRGTRCLILTSGHTVSSTRGRHDVSVLFRRDLGAGTKVRATVLAEQDTPQLDAALLMTAETDRCVPARLATRPALGEPVWVVAFPWGGPMTLATGIVSQLPLEDTQDSDHRSRLMIDALVGYGASGSGVYEARTGRLIGIVEGYSTARVSAQGASSPWYIDVPMPGQTFVTPIGDVLRFLQGAGHDTTWEAPT